MTSTRKSLGKALTGSEVHLLVCKYLNVLPCNVVYKPNSKPLPGYQEWMVHTNLFAAYAKARHDPRPPREPPANIMGIVLHPDHRLPLAAQIL